MGGVADTVRATVTRDRWSPGGEPGRHGQAARGPPRISLRIQGVSDPGDPDDKVWEDGSLLANPHATLAGPTFEAWLDSDDANTTTQRSVGA